MIYGAAQASIILRKAGVSFDVRYGQGTFYYTELVFRSEEALDKARMLLGYTAPYSVYADGTYGLRFY